MSCSVTTVVVFFAEVGAAAVERRAVGEITDVDSAVASSRFSGCTDDSFSLIEPFVLLSDSDFCLLDRKSTRLNSSHANISYAVFCLKKKKKFNFFNSDQHPN